MRWVAAAIIAVVALPAASQPGHPVPATAGSPYASPQRIVTPRFPEGALHAGISGHVDVEGIVLPSHRLRLVRITPGSEAARVFVKPVEEVLPDWLFNPATGTDCLPSKAPAMVRVWFEIDAGKGRIFVSVPQKPETTPGPPQIVVERVDPTFPRSMQRAGLEADVYSGLVVDGDGSVIEVRSETYPGGTEYNAFARSAELAYRRWEFVPDTQRPRRLMCYTLHFRLRP